MTKHEDGKEKSPDTGITSLEQEHIDVSVNLEFRYIKKGKVPNEKLKIEELKRKPLYPLLSDLNAVDSNDSVNQNNVGLNRKVSESDSSVLQKEARQRRAATSTKQSFQEESNTNYYPESKKSKTDEDKPTSSAWKLLCIFLIPLFCLVCYLIYGPPPDQQIDVASIMTTLKTNFDGQPEMTFRIIKSALSRVSTRDPSSPGIVIVISSSEARNIRDSFSLHLAKSISSEYVSIQNNYLKMSGEIKMEIDHTIKNNLTQNNLKAVLVKNLDQIPFEAAMIFHSYCDHENAPFKKAVYVMTMTSDEVIKPNSGPRDWDAVVEKHLNDVWRNSNEDQVSSLISRLSVNVCAIVART